LFDTYSETEKYEAVWVLRVTAGCSYPTSQDMLSMKGVYDIVVES